MSDFGLAIPIGFDMKALGMKDYAYTLHLAPEIRRPQDYSVLSDIYACGMTLYRLVNGDSVLPALAPELAHEQALRGKFPDRSLCREFVPRPLRSVINKALNVDPRRRFQSAADMRHVVEQITVEKMVLSGRVDGIEGVTRSRGGRHPMISGRWLSARAYAKSTEETVSVMFD